MLSSGSSRTDSSITNSDNATYLFKNFVAAEGLTRASYQASASSGRKEISRWPPTRISGGSRARYWPHGPVAPKANIGGPQKC